jgi:hypothetical protein
MRPVVNQFAHSCSPEDSYRCRRHHLVCPREEFTTNVTMLLL